MDLHSVCAFSVLFNNTPLNPRSKGAFSNNICLIVKNITTWRKAKIRRKITHNFITRNNHWHLFLQLPISHR